MTAGRATRGMHRLLVITAQDGSSLVLGERPGDRQQPAALVFEHLGRSEPRPVVGLFSAFSVIVNDQPQIVFAGTTFNEQPVDTVLIQFPDHSRTYPVLSFRDRSRGVWMSLPQPFYVGQRIRVAWLVDSRVCYEETSAPLVWEGPETPDLSPRKPGPRPGKDADEDGFTRTHYAYIEAEERPHSS